MTLFWEQKQMMRAAPCAALRFFDSFWVRRRMRKGMPGFPNSAVFYYHWDLLDTTREPEVMAMLTKEEKNALLEFQTTFDQLKWEVIPDAEHIKQTDENMFRKLKRPALLLLSALKKNLNPHT